MKTPEEIKKGLEACRADECHGHHTGCPYDDDFFCIMHICGDALARIEQLEKRDSLNTLRDAIYEDAVAHGLWEKYSYPKDCVDLIQKEVLELYLEAPDFDDDGEDSYNEYGFSEELSDVIIMCMSVSGKLGIDIDAPVRSKMEINKGRPWKHGKENEGES